jgi:hypothetical protein
MGRRFIVSSMPLRTILAERFDGSRRICLPMPQ